VTCTFVTCKVVLGVQPITSALPAVCYVYTVDTTRKDTSAFIVALIARLVQFGCCR